MKNPKAKNFVTTPKKFITIGIETTAHTFGVGVMENDELVSEERDVSKTKKGGMIPKELSEHHASVCGDVISRALGKRIPDLVAFSQGPGIGHALRIGAVAARSLALKYDIPIIGANHCIAHLEIAKKLTGFSDPIMLYVSGGNTQVIGFESGRYRVFGETLDIGVGNLLDVFGRSLGLGFPAGPEIEKLAATGKSYIELPYSVKGMDISFTGILTKIEKIVNKNNKNDLCHSLQETVFSMLVEVSERAMAHTGKNELVVTGGVASNSRLQEMCRIMCEERGAEFRPIDRKYCTDNGSMIAVLGKIMFDSGYKQKIADTKIIQRWRTDEVEVGWIKKTK
jgi:N6-L-threonylcarbamoyladenine synthase